MWTIKYFILILSASLFFVSCDLFSKDKKKVKGGKVVWHAQNQEALTVSTQPAIEGKKVYLIQDAQLKAFSLKNGVQIWSNQICNTGATCDYSHKIILNKSKVFYDQGYNIKAFSKKSGSLIWKTRVTNIGNEVSGIGSPIMSQDENYLYAGRKGYVVKLRKSNGQIVMKYPLDQLVPEDVSQGSTEPIISPYGDNILYVPTSYYDGDAPKVPDRYGGNLFAFDASSGELLWGKRLEYKVDNTLTDVPDDSVYISPWIFDIAVTSSSIITASGQSIFSVNRFNGEVRWHNNIHDNVDVGMAVKNGGVYLVSLGGNAYKLDLNTGKMIWKTDLNGFSNTSIPTVKNGRLYFINSGGGDLWVLDTENGNVIYHEYPPGHRTDNFDVYISSLAVGKGYMVDVGSQAVYCLTVP